MDWTGGARRRFAATKNNAMLQKQKAHFARVRSALHSAPGSHHGFLPDYLRFANTRGAASRSPRSARPYSDHQRIRDAPGSAGSAPKVQPVRCAEEEAHSPSHHQGRTLSIVSVSGNRSSRSSAPPVPHAKGMNNARPQRLKPSELDHLTDEEALLLAHRRRLLAREDWLGLAPTRPLHIRFPSSDDKERIGKRRKVQKTSHRPKPAGKRLLTPLFEERLQHCAELMSGALPPEDIVVKIGTEAFASQTVPSRQSRLTANTSITHDLSELEALSEESMLLGADGDSFEAEKANLDDPCRAMLQEPATTAIMYSQPPDLRDVLQSFEDGEAVSASVRLEPTSPKAEKWLIPATVRSEGTDGGRHMRNEKDEDDETWRCLLNISKYTSSHASIGAVRSSSQHLTASEEDCRPVLGAFPREHQPSLPTLSTPRGMGTQDAREYQSNVRIDRDVRSTSPHSPPESLKQVLAAAHRPGQPNGKPTNREADEDDALWRSFVIGSGSDDGEVSANIGEPDDYDDIENEITLPIADSSLALSGLGTSDKATLGNTLFLTGSTPPIGHTLSRRTSDKLAVRRSENDDTLQDSAVGKPELITDRDSIEDIQGPAPLARRPSNIHAPQGVRLNPKRFKPGVKNSRGGTLTKLAKVSSRTKPQVVRGARSVYDLLDSDDVSVFL